MTKLQEKAQAQVKQIIGQMIGDKKLVVEGKEQRQKAEHDSAEGNSDQDAVKGREGERAKDKQRAQSLRKTGGEKTSSNKTSSDKPASQEKARDPAARKGPILD